MDSFDITASALTAQRLRMDTISSNLANVNTTRKADGTLGAYHRRNVVFAPILDQASAGISSYGGDAEGMIGSNFSSGSHSGGMAMKSAGNGMSMDGNGQFILKGSVSNTQFNGAGVQVVAISEDTKNPLRTVYDPGNPDANEKGYVDMPNVNTVSEMVDMISASRAYEANVTALQDVKSMNSAALEL